jgi:hypothetical protein
MDVYYNEFRIQGKRLNHIERVEGKKIYIGVQGLVDPKHRGLKGLKNHKDPFAPIMDAISEVDHGVS